MTRAIALIASLTAFAGVCLAMAWVHRKARSEGLTNVLEFPSTEIEGISFYWV